MLTYVLLEAVTEVSHTSHAIIFQVLFIFGQNCLGVAPFLFLGAVDGISPWNGRYLFWLIPSCDAAAKFFKIAKS